MTRPTDAITRREILSSFDSLMRRIAAWHTPEFLEIDVTMSQAKVLYMVSVRPDTNMSMVAAQLQVGLSAVSGLVDRLVDHGYLTRREDPQDRRQHLLGLSPEGALVVERIRELNARHMDRLLAGLTTTELAALRDGMAALDRQAHALHHTTDQPTTRAEKGTPA